MTCTNSANHLLCCGECGFVGAAHKNKVPYKSYLAMCDNGKQYTAYPYDTGPTDPYLAIVDIGSAINEVFNNVIVCGVFDMTLRMFRASKSCKNAHYLFTVEQKLDEVHG